MTNEIQMTLDGREIPSTINNSSTFVDNMNLPLHRWYRYSAGFSAEWVRGEIRKFNDKDIVLLDPFVGSGTAAIAGEQEGIIAYGIESHPFVYRIAKAKSYWREDYMYFAKKANEVRENAIKSKNHSIDNYPKLIRKCYPDKVLKELNAIKEAWRNLEIEESYKELIWLALVTILRSVSPVGTAPWQYILPNKRKKKYVSPFFAFHSQIKMMSEDMQHFQNNYLKSPHARIHLSDARNITEIEDNLINLVITSPPYTNNYDYADATRLEMSFFGEVSGWGDLREKVRPYLIPSCSHHYTAKTKLREILKRHEIDPIRDEITSVCKKLEEERENHGGRKKYYLMIAGYFSDMALVWKELRRVCTEKSKICYVVGDSAPYGIYVPVDEWLGKLAIANGFKSYTIEKFRDRNIKWKNRKHRVPLKEVRLKVVG